jgi:hypothetical protein
MTSADSVWNRAALQSGGTVPEAGDRALAALLLVHGLAMNGGVHHALECVQPLELTAAVKGYAFFGFHEVAAFFERAADDASRPTWTDEQVAEADRQYARLIPDDSHLVCRFEDVFRERADQFAPLT